MRSIKDWYRFFRGDADIPSLKKKGLIIGDNCSIQPRCLIDPPHCWLISIGDNVTLAPNVTILAHDASTKRVLGYTKIGLVTIGDNCFIGAGTVILPGSSIGDNCIIGAGSVVSGDIPQGKVAVGVPAKPISETDNYLAKLRDKLQESNSVFESEWTVKGGITESMKNEMREILLKSSRIGFVR